MFSFIKMFKGKISIEQTERKLLAQFYVTLKATFLDLKEEREAKADAEPDNRFEKIETLLKKGEDEISWKEAYYIEQLLLPLYDPGRQKVEMDRRLVEARQNLNPDLHSHYTEEYKTLKADPDTSSVLLGRLVNDLQWRNSVRQAHRDYANKARNNTNWMFFAAIFLFLLPTGLLVLNTEFLEPQFKYHKVYTLITAIAAGFLGSTFSILIGLKKQIQSSDLDNLKVIHKPIFILSRAIIGVGAALIFFYFLQSGMVSGNLFPRFKHRVTIESVTEDLKNCLRDKAPDHNAAVMVETDQLIQEFSAQIVENHFSGNGADPKGAVKDFIKKIKKTWQVPEEVLKKELEYIFLPKGIPTDFQHYALLIVWCFLAGFSEKMVPNLLSKTEARLGKEG
jgi:hypothetical protein